MLFPKVNKISIHISTVSHITEQKLCCTFNNCSLCDRLNFRKKGLSALSGSVRMKSVVKQGLSMNSSKFDNKANFESVENVRSSNVVNSNSNFVASLVGMF